MQLIQNGQGFELLRNPQTGMHELDLTFQALDVCSSTEITQDFNCVIRRNILQRQIVNPDYVHLLSQNMSKNAEWLAKNAFGGALSDFSLQYGTNFTQIVNQHYQVNSRYKKAWFVNPFYRWQTTGNLLALAEKTLLLGIVSLNDGNATVQRRLLWQQKSIITEMQQRSGAGMHTLANTYNSACHVIAEQLALAFGNKTNLTWIAFNLSAVVSNAQMYQNVSAADFKNQVQTQLRDSFAQNQIGIEEIQLADFTVANDEIITKLFLYYDQQKKQNIQQTFFSCAMHLPASQIQIKKTCAANTCSQNCSHIIQAVLQAASQDCYDVPPTTVQNETLVKKYQYDIGFSFYTDMQLLCDGGLGGKKQTCDTCQKNQECPQLACQIAHTLQYQCAWISVWLNRGAYSRKLLQYQPSILLTFYESSDAVVAEENTHDTRQAELQQREQIIVFLNTVNLDDSAETNGNRVEYFEVVLLSDESVNEDIVDKKQLSIWIIVLGTSTLLLFLLLACFLCPAIFYLRRKSVFRYS